MIELASPNLNEEDIQSAVEVLRSGLLVQGRHVEEFEKNLAAFLDVPHAVAVSNGTASLHLALVSLGIGPGDEVIVPSFSFMATANAVEVTGATPIFVDIDAASFNIDVPQIEAAITSRTKAILPVHEFGLPCQIEQISRICKENELFLIEDAACALGSTCQGKHAGTYGHYASFSLHPRKAITCGEGGVLVTHDAALAHRIRILRNHGIDSSTGAMEFEDAGFNYRLTDFQAALLTGQLKRLPDAIRRRQDIAARFLAEIANPLITLPSVKANLSINWQTFHVMLDPLLDRQKVIGQLRESGINTNYGAQCMPAQAFYRRKYGLDCEALFPAGMAAWKRGLAIPVHEKLEDHDVSQIIDQINLIHQPQ